MLGKLIKIVGIGLAILALFYAIQYVSTAIHAACANPQEDCPPPFYLAGELGYKVIVQPPWLDKFNQ